MQMRRPIDEVIAELRTWRKKSGLSYAQIADLSGVNLSTIYRQFDSPSARLRYGSALKRVCKIAKISLDVQAPEGVPSVVRRAVLETWDGTPEHALRLAKVIKAVGELLRPVA
jgi:transcriptional regulator with XRE-family HTH domain